MADSRLKTIQNMLKDEPHDSFLNYALALEYAKEGDIQKAIELIESLLSKNPDYIGAYYQLGKYYEQTGQLQSAINTYNVGITIAQKQNNKKTLGELNEALLMIEDSD
jgi:tetratricopeptide (TPR) repeat protein